MTSEHVSVPAHIRGRFANAVLWTAQILMSVFFLAGAAGPKLLGQEYAVHLFDQIGAGQWLRYAVGVVELAGLIGLLIPRLAGLAALGLFVTMIGATLTQVVVLHSATGALTPASLAVVLALIAWVRRDGIVSLLRSPR